MRTGLVLPSRIENWATTLSVATSMTVTFPPASADTQARVPSGVKATVRGLSPTCSVFNRRPVFGSSTETVRSEEHTSELQSQSNLVCRLLLEKKKKHITRYQTH